MQFSNNHFLTCSSKFLLKYHYCIFISYKNDIYISLVFQFLPHALNESFIDFGTLGMGDKRTVVFAVINENPVDVSVFFFYIYFNTF